MRNTVWCSASVVKRHERKPFGACANRDGPDFVPGAALEPTPEEQLVRR